MVTSFIQTKFLYHPSKGTEAHMTWHCASHNSKEKGHFKANIQHQTKQAPNKEPHWMVHVL